MGEGGSGRVSCGEEGKEKLKRGSLYWINLEPGEPPEFGKMRPGIVVSNSDQNLSLPTVVIVPVSSQAPEIWPLRLKFKVRKGRDSFAVIPGIRQVHKKRLHQMMGTVEMSFLERLDEALKIYLSD